MLLLQTLQKSYPGFSLEVSLEIAEGETLALLGPSGSGKSTLLRLVAGLETPDTGQVFLDGKDLTHLPPEARNMGMVFQDYSLFPHLNVYQNLAFGLQEARWEPAKLASRVEELLRATHLESHLHKRPHQLSGGERQRVALGRALANLPRVLLMDEPLGALDLTLREELLLELRQILRQTRIPTLIVTHDQTEAFALAHRVAVMRNGKIVQLDAPETLYNQPKDVWTAKFLGHDNVLSAGQSQALNLPAQPHLLPLGSFRWGRGTETRVLERLFLGPRIRLRLDWKGLELVWEGPDFGTQQELWLELDLSQVIPLQP